MRDTTSRPLPSTRLWAPVEPWLDHVRAFVLRDTRGCRLAGRELVNRFPASSHFARDCKAQTGRTPTQLVREVQTEEADWIYRLEFPYHEDPPSTRSS